ncbi:MAG: PaaI family thioesterase [Burkholderiales bacterium]|jgi:uncharacterized protein (TIGR00369 family)|nr:PaaI family thioesterase [Burkholderiales bacterium]
MQPRDPDYVAHTRASFARQDFMATLGAQLAHVAAGAVDIALPFGDHLRQQHGFVHAGAIASVLDSACGYAAFTLMPAGAAVLTIEFKVNLLAPAAGVRFVAIGRVVKAGRTISVADAQALAIDAGGREKRVATMTATLMTVERDGLAG